MARLDRTKPFNTVYGLADFTYSQNGKRFDHEGNEVGAKPEPVIQVDELLVSPINIVVDELEIETPDDLEPEDEADDPVEPDREHMMKALDDLGIEYNHRLRFSAIKEIYEKHVFPGDGE